MPKYVLKKAIDPAEVSTWRNKFYDYHLVQALCRRDEPHGKFLHRDRCRHWVPRFIPLAPEGVVTMADGTTKPVIAIAKGDQLLHDGKVVRALGVMLGDRLAEVWLEQHECAGTSKQALSGVLLDRLMLSLSRGAALGSTAPTTRLTKSWSVASPWPIRCAAGARRRRDARIRRSLLALANTTSC